MIIIEDSLKIRIQKIKIIAFDVDGVFTDGSLYYDKEGDCLKKFSVLDGVGIMLLKFLNIQTFIISARFSKANEARFKEINLDGVIHGSGNKGEEIKSILKDQICSKNEIAFVGDDFPDLLAFEQCGLSIAVNNAVPYVKQKADLVTENIGGRGAVREVAELFCTALGVSPCDLFLENYKKTEIT